MMNFIQSDSENLNKILAHLQTSAIMDLLLTLVRMEELSEGKGVVKVSDSTRNIYFRLNLFVVVKRAWIIREFDKQIRSLFG
jgi:serine/threonine-protein phosphatase 6 regulatory subunit 3